MTETAAHGIQKCFRLHGGVVLRHNAVVKVLQKELDRLGLATILEPHVQTPVGLRKPDLVAYGPAGAYVIDAQVVSASTAPLDQQHTAKVKKYSDIDEIREWVATRAGVPEEIVKFASCTLSWRGIWSGASARDMLEIGVPERKLVGITTRVLQGSHTNWTRWNRQTELGEGSTESRRLLLN